MEEALDINQNEDIFLWIDDFGLMLPHPESLSKAQITFIRYRDCKIRLSAKKWDLYLQSVSDFIQEIQDLGEPKTVSDLQKYICSLNWMRTSISHYNREDERSTECFRLIIEKLGSNNKKILARRLLSPFLEWDDAAKLFF